MRGTIVGATVAGVLAIAVAVSLSAQGDAMPPLSTATYDMWTPQQMAKAGRLANYGSYTVSVNPREVSAAPEVHDANAHFMMFTSGEGTFVVGGKIVKGADGKNTVEGGETLKIVHGQMYHIPAKTVHWVRPSAGTVNFWIANLTVPKS